MKYPNARHVEPISSRKWSMFAYGLLIAVMCISVSCKSFISYYDAVTYQNLTDLKPSVLFLYETFKSDDVNETDIREIHLQFAQAHEFEKGKGPSNEPTRKQIKIIWDMFEDHVKDRLETGKWSDVHCENNKDNITAAFDKAIETEMLKNTSK